MLGRRMDARLLRLLTHDRNRKSQDDLDREARAPTFDLEAASSYLERVRTLLFGGDFPVDPGLSYLDVGCGMGRLSLGLARAGVRDVTAVDLVAHNIRMARGLAEGLPPGRVPTFVHADIHAWDPGRKFDVIVVLGAMEHIREPARFLRWLAGTLAPGGLACVSIEPFHSPFGDHMRAFFRVPVPWSGLLFSEEAMLEVRRERFRPSDPARRYAEIQGGMNQLRYGVYRRSLREAGLRFRARHVNPQLRRGWRRRPLALASDVLTAIPMVRDYFVVCEYGVLEAASDGVSVPAPAAGDGTASGRRIAEGGLA